MEIITISGPLCSGKNYYSQLLNKEAKIIDIGDIVREITNNETRVFDKSLDTLIIKQLEQEIKQSATPTLIIIGMRQITILQAIERIAKQFSINVLNYLLDVDVEVREQRYVQRNAYKDSYTTFEIADQKDRELGLTALIRYLRSRKDTQIVKNQ